MKLSALPKFDASPFTPDELRDLQGFVDQCGSAKNPGAIEEAGAELDTRRADQRAMVRQVAARSRSLQAVFKHCIREVPRPMDHPEPEDSEVVA